MPWEDEAPERAEGAAMVLGEMGLSGDESFLLVSCRVVEFTVESKVNDGNYGSARGYVRLEPENLRLHVPVYNLGECVDDTGNVGLLGAVYRYVARELDRMTFQVATERVDRVVVEREQERAVKEARFDAGTVRKEVQRTTETETL